MATGPRSAAGSKRNTETPTVSPKHKTQHHQMLAAWIFGAVLLLFFMAVFFLIPDEVTQTRYLILRIRSSILVGLFAFFLVGGMKLAGSIPLPEQLGGEFTVKAFGGFAMFLLVLFYGWPSVVSPPASPPAPQLSELTLYVRRDQQDDSVQRWNLIA